MDLFARTPSILLRELGPLSAGALVVKFFRLKIIRVSRRKKGQIAVWH